jgi:hypothetical protein
MVGCGRSCSPTPAKASFPSQPCVRELSTKALGQKMTQPVCSGKGLLEWTGRKLGSRGPCGLPGQPLEKAPVHWWLRELRPLAVAESWVSALTLLGPQGEPLPLPLACQHKGSALPSQVSIYLAMVG